MEFIMRLFLAALIALGAFAVVPDDADARKRARAPYAYRDYGPPPPWAYAPPPPRYGYRYRESEQSDSMECIEARNLDPGGDYASYPCWAQRALAPKKHL